MKHGTGDNWRCWDFIRCRDKDTPDRVCYECTQCHKQFLADKLIQELRVGWTGIEFGGLTVDGERLGKELSLLLTEPIT